MLLNKIEPPPGRRSYLKQFKLVYNMKSKLNSRFAFKVELDADYEIADYYMLKDLDNIFQVSNFN